MEKLRRKIRMFAFHTRLFILILQFVCNWVIPDHEADAFQWPIDPAWVPTIADKLVGFLLDGLIRWDGAHFLHIAHHGYTFETNLAFFPLYPLLVRTLAIGLHWLQEDYAIISFVTSLKLSAVFLSNAFFILATEALYDLSRKVLKDEYLAYKAALFFAINPANIFFAAPYSESLNALLTFFTLYKISKQFSAVTCITIAMASATRANSILNCGHVVYNSLKIVATEMILYVRMKKAKAKAELSTTIANILGDAIIPGLFNLVGCVGSFIFFQYFCFTNFCRVKRRERSEMDDFVVDYGRRELLKVAGDTPSPWCHNEPPLAYSYIQKVHWDNGFLAYWDTKQLPNFLLAVPCVLMVLHHSWEFVQVHWDYVKRLGLVDNNLLGMPRRPCLAVRQYSPEDDGSEHLASKVTFAPVFLFSIEGECCRVLPRECFVYVVHATALTIFGIFFMHVQVTTRLLLASSPVLPWLAAILTTRRDKPAVALAEGEEAQAEALLKIECKTNLESSTDTILFQEKLDTDVSRWVMMYFLGYTLVGTILFCNHLPWT